MAAVSLTKVFIKTILILTSISLLEILESSSAMAATYFLQDKFDTENFSTPKLNYEQFANWNIVKGNVDLIGKGTSLTLSDLVLGNGLYLDMDGSTYNAGKIESKTEFTFNSGNLIHLQFKLAGHHRINRQNNSVIVSLGSLFTETFSLSSFEDFQTFSRNIVVTSESRGKLSFEGTGYDSVGMLLDDINLSITYPNSTPIPEANFILGLLTLGAINIFFLLKYQLQQKKMNNM